MRLTGRGVPGELARPSRRAALLVGLLLLVPAGLVRAQEEELDQGKVYAIQPRSFRMNHEFSVAVAFLPLDAFYKFFAVSGHYVLHFDELWAWEAVHLSFSKYLDIDTGLKKQMMDDWDVSPTDTPKIDYFLDTNLMVKPLYGKMALFDSWVVYMQSYFILGLGAVKYETAWFPSIDAGTGLRVFLNSSLSLRLEVRDYVTIGQGGVDNSLYFGLAFCYNAFAEEKGVTHHAGR